MFSGVFQERANIPYTNLLEINADSNTIKPVPQFNQLLNQYHSAHTSFYSYKVDAQFFLFFGGIAQYYFNDSGLLTQDPDVPVVSTVSVIERTATNEYSEYALPIQLPKGVGAGTEFIPANTVPRMEGTEVIDLESLQGDSQLLGHLVGGFSTTAPNVFFDNDANESKAEAYAYAVYWKRNNEFRDPARKLSLKEAQWVEQGNNGRIHFQAFTNTENGKVYFIIQMAEEGPCTLTLRDESSKLQTIERDLKSVVFGQDKAIEVLASAVKMARSGLGKTDKPIGAFLFSGPTGVGKTEAAKQLAYIMGIELIRFDMSEYMERHAVSRLIGAPPGYVGFDQGGLLTEAVTKKPHCVLLLDEIEKAHPDIFNVLLQVMDHGTLTDNNGRKADFRNVIIIMTTNAGAETMNKATIGFTNPRQAGDEMGDIKRLFTPEFRNRLDAMVSFKALDEQIIMRVVDKFLLQLETQLSEKKVDVTFSDKLRKFLAKKGFDPLMGARPMQRLIQDTIRKALADELLFGRLTEGGRLTVDIDDKDEVLLDIQPLPKKESKASKSEPTEPEEATAD